MRRILFLLVLLLGSVLASPAGAQQNVIRFGPPETANNFPDSLTFQVAVSSESEDIVSAALFYGTQRAFSSQSMTRVAVAVTPGREVDLRFEWNTSQTTVAPSTPIVYYWQVTDAAGNRARSAEQSVRYDDTRFDWQVRENEAIAVWWHDRPEAFGDQVFAIATRAVAAQRDLYDADLSYQMRIIIYNEFAEFEAWHGTVGEFVGGEAFTNLGITTQVVSAYGSQERWLNDVVPHEISHLYFAQVTYNPTAPTPVWLDEGVAQYNEFSDYEGTIRYVEGVAADGDLIPLSSLAQGFGMFNETRARLAYDEALSAVVYLIETHGEKGLADLLAAYRNGAPTDEAFPAGLGVGAGEFEAGWATWLGIPAGAYVTPTPFPIPTFRPSPTAASVVRATPVADATTVTREATVTPAGTTLASAATPAPTAAATPVPGPTLLPLPNISFSAMLAAVCCFFVVLVLLVAALIVWQRR